MAIKAIIFDIDGVLADSREAVVKNTSALLHEFGFSVSESDVEKMSSAHSAETVLTTLVPKLVNDRATLGRMLQRLSGLTVQNMDLVKPLPLAAKVPDFAGEYSLAAATNRKGSGAMVLEKFGLLPYFSVVLTSADAPPKPNPEMIRLALEKLGVRADEALFVGDNKEDELAGIGAGVAFELLDGSDMKKCEQLVSRLL